MTLTRQTSRATPASLVASWQRAYAKRLFITDLIVIVVSVYVSQFIRFGAAGDTLRIPTKGGEVYEISYTLVSAILVLGWFASLAIFATRDRTGIRPLFHAERGGRFAFASEVKALFALPGFARGLDRRALGEICTY